MTEPNTPDSLQPPMPETPTTYPNKPKPNPLRWLIIAILGLALAAIGYYFWQKNNGDTAKTGDKSGKSTDKTADKNGAKSGGKNSVTSVTVAPSTRQDITLWQELPATVIPLQQVFVRPTQAGQIRELLFQDGQYVKKGQVLAKLDDRLIIASLKQAQAIFNQTQAQLITAKQTQARYQSLLAQNAVSRQEVEKANGDTGVILAQQAAAQSQIQSAQIQLENTLIKAPFAGQVGIHKVSVGGQVTPTDANGIVTLTQTQPIAISFGVPSSVANRRSPKGLPVQIWSFDSQSQLIGNSQISVVDAQIDSTTGSLPVQALFANSNQKLAAGQSVKVKLVTQQFTQAVTVPLQAVQKGLEGDFVLVAIASGDSNEAGVASNVAKMQPIKVVGQTDTVAIVEGLDAGVNVVIDGANKVRDGNPIRITQTPAPSDKQSTSQSTSQSSNQSTTQPTSQTASEVTNTTSNIPTNQAKTAGQP